MADRGMPQGSALQAGSPPNPRTGAAGFPSRGMGTYSPMDLKRGVHKPGEYEESFDDSRDPEKMARLYAQSVGYKNLAGNRFIDEQARAAVTSGLKDVFNVMEFLRNKWLIMYRLYRGETLTAYTYGRTQLHSPEPFKIVETIVPRLYRHLFGANRWFKLEGHADHHDSAAEAQEMLCRDQFRKNNFKSKAMRFLRNGCIYGTAVQKTYWDQKLDDMIYRKARRVPDPDIPGGSKVELDEVKRQELVFDGNQIENVEIFDFFTSPNASSVFDAEWCADRSSWPDWRVKQMGELGHWVGLQALKDRASTNDISFGDEFKERKSYSYGVFDPREASFAPHIPHYEVIDWWGPLVIEDNKGNYVTKQCNVVMIDPDGLKLIVRVTENPYWHKQKPYQAFRPITLENEFYGIGPLEPIARLSLEKDMKRNLLMASTQLEANPMWMVSDEANISEGQLLIQPGHTIRVPNIQESIAPLHVPQVSDAALKAERVITQDIRETAGTTSPSMGAADPLAKSKTATQHTSELDEANLRMLVYVQNYEEDVEVPMLEQMAFNNMQFMSYPRVVRQIGGVGLQFNDRVMIRPEDIVGRFIVTPLASTKLTTKQTMVQQLVNLLDRAPVINQMYGPQAVKMPQLLNMILEQGFDIPNSSDFIAVPPEESGLMTAFEEHECWYHGNIPPRRVDDNDQRHYLAHMEEFKTDRWREFSQKHPGLAAHARAHVAQHARKLMLVQEYQEQGLMQGAQLGALQQAMNGGQGGGGSPVPGAAGPGQEPGSPQVRRNENERGEGSQTKSDAMRGAPNPGAA